MLLKTRQIFNKISEIKLQHYYNLFAIIIVFCIILSGFYALSRPVSVIEFQQIKKISEQAIYPKSQKLAQTILMKPEIHRDDYFKLIHAYQSEYKAIKQYPAVSADE